MPRPRPRLTPSSEAAPLTTALAALRVELDLPTAFPPEAEAEAARAAETVPTDPELAGVDDLRGIPFLTIDPEGSTDLDQALHIARSAGGAVVHYAIADVPAFVEPDGAVDTEARRRGQTLYLPDGRIPLHPTVLSEHAVSLLPGVDRRALVWRFELDERGAVLDVSLCRATVRSRRQWSYEQAQAAIDAGTAPAELAGLAWVGERRAELEHERDGASLDVPETDIVIEHDVVRLERVPGLPVERWNAQLSLMTGMAAADLMLAGGIGILRTMPPAADDDLAAFREQTAALGLPWPRGAAYGDYLRGLDRARPAALAILDAATGLFRGAGYAAFDGEPPEQSTQAAIGAPYAHATAPLRRLVDRWSLVICEALANGRDVPSWARDSLPEVPALMARSDALAGRLGAAALDRVEAAVLAARVGETLDAVVLRARGGSARVQLVDPPVTATATGAGDAIGGRIRVRVVRAEVATGEIELVADRP